MPMPPEWVGKEHGHRDPGHGVSRVGRKKGIFDFEENRGMFE